ncbi:hypothetical protein ACHWQZ_G009192 [Mnemiopsis leidyi]
MPSFIKKLGSCVVRMPLSEPNVERYLDEHPGFLQKYVVTHLSETDLKDLYEHWYKAHGRKSSTEKERKRSRTEEEGKSCHAVEHKTSIVDNQLVVPPAGKATLETPTPEEAMDVVPSVAPGKQLHQFPNRQFRKTVSREGAPILKPYRRSFSDDLINIRSLLPTNLQLPGEPGARRRSREEWRQLNEPDLMMELVRDIAQDLDLVSLCFKILLNVGILTNGDRCSLFLIFGSGDQRFLVSKLFDVTENSQLTDMYEHKPIRIPYGKGIVGYVAESGETVNIPDAYQDERFNKAIDMQTGFRTKSILCMPVKNNQSEIVGVAQVINKKDEEGPFTANDEKIFERYLTFCGIGITNALLFQSSVIMYKRSDSLVLLAHYIFEEQRDMNNLLRRVLKKGCEMFSSTGCRILLRESPESDGLTTVEPENGQVVKSSESFVSCFEIYTGDDIKNKESGDEYEFQNILTPQDALAKFVAEKLKTINAVPGEPIEGFEGMVCAETIGADREIRSVLAMPILNESRNVLGVVEILNKKGEERFDRNDESLFEAFTLFCGLGIYNVMNFERLIKANNAQKVVLEILSYHASANKDEVSLIEREEIPSADSLNILSFEFADHSLDTDQTVLATIRMFMDLDLINKFRIDFQSLIRWSITVRKNYRDVMYHNWRHGFNVAQMMFAMLTSGQMSQQFTDLEVFALLVGSLCHDIDHRGTTNQFQKLSDSPLANLYSTSFMEYHHFNHFLTISQVEGNNIFKSLNEKEYADFLDLTKTTILATDLALYFKHKALFKQLVENPSTNWDDGENRVLLRSMMITGCDLSAITKPWEVQRMVAEKIASEFFNQGDIERDKFGHTPAYMMDRSKRDELPKMQVGFIDNICLELYESLEKANPLFRPLLDGCLSNRRNWSNLCERRTSFADISSANITLTSINTNRPRDSSFSDEISDSDSERGESLKTPTPDIAEPGRAFTVGTLSNQPEEESGVEG